jgi:hypothetical protein
MCEKRQTVERKEGRGHGGGGKWEGGEGGAERERRQL